MMSYTTTYMLGSEQTQTASPWHAWCNANNELHLQTQTKVGKSEGRDGPRDEKGWRKWGMQEDGDSKEW